MADRDVLINVIVNGRNNAAKAIHDAQQNLEDLTKTGKNYQKQLVAENKELGLTAARVKQIGDNYKKVETPLNNFKQKTEALVTSLKEFGKVTDDSTKSTNVFADTLDSVSKSALDMRSKLEASRQTMRDYGKTTRESANELEVLKQITEHYTASEMELVQVQRERKSHAQDLIKLEREKQEMYRESSRLTGRSIADLKKETAAMEEAMRVRDLRNKVKEAPENFLYRMAGGRGTPKERGTQDRNEQFRNLRGLTSELRGFSIAFITKNVEGLASAAVGAAGGLTSLAGSALSAGTALAGGLAAGAAQAIGPLTILMATVGRLTAITKVVNLQQQIKEAATHTKQSGAAANAADQVTAAEENLANAQRGALKAQKDLNDARKEAIRDLEDMNLAQIKANLSLEDAQRQYDMARQGNDIAAIAEAKVALDQSKLDASRGKSDYRDARNNGVSGAPGVVAARERLADANRQLAQSTRALAQAQTGLGASADGATASEDRLAYMLGQLTPSERDLVKNVEKFQDSYKKAFRGITDNIIEQISYGVEKGIGILGNKDIMGALGNVSKEIAYNMKRVTDYFSSPKSLKFLEYFIGSSSGNLNKATTGFINLAQSLMNIAVSAMPIFNHALDRFVDLTDKILNSTSDLNKLGDFFKDSERDLIAWEGLLGSIWNIFKQIFDPARDAGTSMIVGWTKNINEFANTLSKNQGKVRQFFYDGVEVSNQLLRVVWELGKALYSVFDPESAKDLADFIVMILIPAFTTAIRIIGIFTKTVQQVLTLPVVHNFAQWIVTIVLVSRAFGVITTAIKNLTAAMAVFSLKFFEGGGLLTSFTKLAALVAVIIAGLSAMGVKFDWLANMSDSLKVALANVAIAMSIAFGVRAAGGVAVLTTRVRGLIGAVKTLAAMEGIASIASMFGGGRSGRNMPGGGGMGGASPVLGGLGKLSKGAKIGLGAGAAVGAGSALAGAAVGGKTGSFISGVGTGAATGAMVGTAFGPWGTAIGAVAGGLVGLGTAYLSTKDKQDEFLKSTKKTVDALYEQLNAIREVQNAKLDQKDTKLSYQQAQIDYRSARRNVGTVYNQLRAQGMSDKEAKGSDPYKQAVIERQRALIQLKRTNEAWKNSDKDVAATQRASGKKIITNMGEIRKNILSSSNAILKAQDKLKDSKGEVAQALQLYGKDSVQYKEALKNQKKAQDNLTQANKNYRKELQKLPQEYATVKSGNKVLGKSFGAVRNTFLRLIEDIVTGTNGVLKEFGADQVKVSMQGGHVVATGDSGSGEAKTIVDPGLATGGFIGRSGMRGRDTVRAVLGKGEAVLNHTQQKVVNSALYNSGINGLGEVFNRTKGSLHYMARGGFAGSVTGDTDYMPALGRALKRMSAATGVPISVNSGRRTMAEQTALYNKYLAGTGNLAAKPSPNAPHVRGIAADISPGRERFGAIAQRFGLGFTVPSESWHIQLLNAVGSMAGKASAAVASALSSPKIKSNNKLFRGVLNNISKRLTRAANKLIGKRTGGPSGSGDGGHINLMPKGKGETVGASIFGGPGDPGTGHIGYRGDDLNANPDSYAELSNNPGAGVGGDFAALGGLPYRAKLRITGPRGSAIAYKRDVGAGGGAVSGHKRAIDLWYSLGQKLGINGLGLVKIQRLARGGFAGAFANGGTVPGKGAVPILAHAGEWILNQGQQAKAASLAGMTTNRLRASLGFSGGNGSFTGGGVVMDQSGYSDAFNAQSRNLKSGKFSKFEKALRMLTAENGYIAQFMTAFETFTTRLDNQLKRLTYHIGGKGYRLLSELEEINQHIDDLGKETAVISKERKKVRLARRRAQRTRAKQEKSRNDADEDLGDLYDRVEARQEAGLDTEKLERQIKRREARLKKKNPKRLKKFKAAQKRLGKARKGVKALNQADEDLKTKQAELAQEAYEASISAIDIGAGASADRAAQSDSDAEYFSKLSVGNAASGALAAMRNAGLANRNNDIASLIAQYRAADPLGKDSEVQKKIQDLANEMRDNTLQMKENEIATMANTTQLHQSILSFRSGTVNSGIGVIKSIGALTGTTNNSLISSLLGKNTATLTSGRTNLLGDLNGLLGSLGIAGVSGTGESLISSLVNLSSMDTTGWMQSQKDLFESLINALIDNEAAIVDNSQQLKDLNGNNDQGFSSYSWTAFRRAVFNGTGGLLPQYQSVIPHMAVGGSVVNDGLAYLHSAEVVLNKGQAKNWNGNSGNVAVHVTNPTEVADPVYLGNKLMFELNNRGK